MAIYNEKDILWNKVLYHLVDTVKELQQQGKSEEESTTIALQRFGEGKLINTELRKVYKFHNRFRKSMLIASGIFLLLSLLFLGLYLFIERNNTSDFDGMQRDFHIQIAEKLTSDDTITSADIESFFKEHKRILRFVYLYSNSQAFVYPSDTTKVQLTEQPYITYPIPFEGSNPDWQVKVALKSEVLFSQTPYYAIFVSAICFAAYWILYGLWNVLHAYRMGQLNLGRIVIFFSLNVFGYLLFRLGEKIKKKSLMAVA